MKPKNTENSKFVEKRRIKWNENDGKKSGEVIISYEKLTNLLLQPLISGPTLKKTP